MSPDQCTLFSLFLLPLNDDLETSISDRLEEQPVVAFALVGISDGELGDGLVELVALTEITANRGGLAGASV